MGGKSPIYLGTRESMQALIGEMPLLERCAYEAFEHRQKFVCFPGRRLVVFDQGPSGAENIDVLLFSGIEIDRKAGPVALAQDRQGPVLVRPTPTRYRDREIFLQIPTSFELEWKGQQVAGSQVEYQPHYAVLVKVAKKEYQDGRTYCLTLNAFRERYPDLNLRY